MSTIAGRPRVEDLRTAWVTSRRYDEKPAFDAFYDALYPPPKTQEASTP